MNRSLSRRQMLAGGSALAAASLLRQTASLAAQSPAAPPAGRPAPADRRFRSPAVERYILDVAKQIGDPVLARMFTRSMASVGRC